MNTAQKPRSATRVPGGSDIQLCLCGILMVILFLLEMFILDRRSVEPILYRLHYSPAESPTPILFGISLLAVALAQTFILLVIYRMKATRSRRSATVLSIAVAACMLIAIRAPLTTSNDLYLYMGYAKLPSFASVYAPPPQPFQGQFSMVNTIWKLPLRPSLYGPLWVALDRELLHGIESIAQGVERLRITGVLMMLLLLLLVRNLWPQTQLVWLVGLNPAFILEYIVNAHNDLVAILLLVFALTLSKRGLLTLGLLVGALAALVKATFLIVAIATLASFGNFKNRFSAVLLIIGIAAIPSWFLGGKPYFSALTAAGEFLGTKSVTLAGFQLALHLALVAVMLLATLLVFYRKAFLKTAGWTFPALSTRLFPWYLGWGLSYALHRAECATVFLIGLPLLDIMVAATFPSSRTVARVLILVLVCVELARTKKLLTVRNQNTN